jgi:hypothetical protein
MADYYLVPGFVPSSAKMHILTNGNANIGSTNPQLVTNGSSSLTMSVNGNVNSGGNIGGSVGIISAPYYSFNPTGGSSGTTIVIPAGPTSQRPSLSYSLPGYLRYNTDASYSTLEYFRTTNSAYLQLYSPPIVTNISPSSIILDDVGTQNITITGTNFDTNYAMSVVFYSNTYSVVYISTNVLVTSTTSITATVPSGVYSSSNSIANSPYTVRVISNFTGMGSTTFNALTVTAGSFVWVSPSTNIGTLYTSISYSKTNNPGNTVARMQATYAGTTVTNFAFNPASAGYSLVNGTSLTIDASGYITGTVRNGYVATVTTVTVGVIAYSPTADTSYNQNLTITFQPLLLSFTTSGGQTVTPVNTYTYTYYAFTNSNTPNITGSNSPPVPATAATYTLTLGATIPSTSIYSADPSYSYIDFLIVGGGGGGGSGYQGGGGGAGGLVSSGLNSNYTYNYNVGGSGGRADGLGCGPYQVPQGLTTANTISITVGGGGPGGYYTPNAPTPYNNRSVSGGNSSVVFPVSNSTTISYTAYGGGGGAGEQNISSQGGVTGVNYQPLPGGCGGGSSHGMAMAFLSYSTNSMQITASYSGSPNYILTVTSGPTLTNPSEGIASISPFLAVYQSTSTTPPFSSFVGFISLYGTNGTTGGGGVGTYFLTGQTVSAGGTYATAPASSAAIGSTTFTIPGGVFGAPVTPPYTGGDGIYTGIPNGSGTTYVGNYSLGFNNSANGGLIDTVTGYQGYNGGYGYTNNPYVGAGGGGASANGGNATSGAIAGAGGNGRENFIRTVNFGTTSPAGGSGTVYAGGGGGSARIGTAGGGAGGTGGGGAGVNTWATPGTLAGNGTAGLGGGGGSAGGSGGAGTNGQYGGSGGSGYVVVRYRSG